MMGLVDVHDWAGRADFKAVRSDVELERSVRDSDVVGRYGGEEFFVILPYADAVAAKDYGYRLLANIREVEFSTMPSRQVTASAGVALSHPHQRRFSAIELISRADEALYKSKREGRDRLTVANLDLVSNGI
jgi:diguanylate cyclase (GGDEF)-like protein